MKGKQQGNEDVENELCEIELDDQTEISSPDEENQNDQNYSQTVSSELHETLVIVRLVGKVDL